MSKIFYKNSFRLENMNYFSKNILFIFKKLFMLKIWAHTSIAWWIYNSFQRSAEIWWNCLQIFAKSPRWWNFVYDSLDENYINLCRENMKKYGQTWWVIHSIYLVNLAKPFSPSTNDVNSVIDDIKIADAIWFEAVNVHLWKFWEQSVEVALNNMVENVWFILEQTQGLKPYFVFENTAGQWSEIGSRFEQLWELYSLLENKFGKKYINSRIRFCIDTAHTYWAWYDVRDFETVLKEFDKNIWIDKILCFHLNDSKAILASKLDRHASLWTWFVGIKWLLDVVSWAEKNDKSVILETPEMEKWSFEIQFLKDFVDGKLDSKTLENFHKQNYKTQILKKFENLQWGLF